MYWYYEINNEKAQSAKDVPESLTTIGMVMIDMVIIYMLIKNEKT